MNNRKYYWNGTKSELIELCYVLYETKRIEDYDGKTVTFLELCNVAFDLFQLKSPKYPYLRISQMKLRKNKESSNFLYKAIKKIFNR